MSKRRYRVPAGRKHAPADHRRAHGGVDLAQRQALYKETYERFAAFYGIAEVELAISLYRETVLAHRRERAAREASLDSVSIQENRWQVAPSLALRAARALEQAADRLRKLQEECREAALRWVEQQLGPDPSHDAAVTEGVGGLPPYLSEPADESTERAATGAPGGRSAVVPPESAAAAASGATAAA